MKNLSFLIILFLTIITTLSSCAAIGEIFKAGMGFGIFIVIIVIALVVFLVTRMGKTK